MAPHDQAGAQNKGGGGTKFVIIRPLQKFANHTFSRGKHTHYNVCFASARFSPMHTAILELPRITLCVA
jgi:hypothetical protein